MTQDQIDQINDELDEVTEKEFKSDQEAYEAISSVLTSYGIEVPLMTAFDDEMVFNLVSDDNDTTSLYLYFTSNIEDGKYEVYATIVDGAELNILDSFLQDEVGEDEHHIRNRKTTES